jgi:hypothetical protein
MTEEMYSFQQSEVPIKVFLQELLQDLSGKTALILPSCASVIKLADSGLLFEADQDFDFIEQIMDALDNLQYTALFDTSSSEDDGIDSAALRRHIKDKSKAAELIFSAKVDENLERGKHDRRPPGDLVKNYYCRVVCFDRANFFGALNIQTLAL